MLEAIVFDWAGTLVDFGSRAPLSAFVELFAQQEIEVTLAEAREPMGTEKREHICSMLAMPRIAKAWQDKYNAAPSEEQIDALYQQLIPLQQAQIELHSAQIPGASSLFERIKERGLRTGSTTGYSRSMIEAMLISAESQGIKLDAVVASDEVGRCRPAATATLQNLVNLNVESVRNCVKVDDTIPGIWEGRNAGMWTVAVVLSGNALGLSEQQWNALSSPEQQQHRQQAYRKMENCGADYLIDSVADLDKVLSDIELRLSRGEKP